MHKRLFLSPPHMTGNEQKYIDEVFQSNYIAPLGAFVDRFEEMVSAYTGAKHALATSSGTAAIHLALRVLGIGEGDIVLASTFTFIGSVAPILYQNATPVFIDSDASWQLDPSLLKKAVAELPKKPKALIVTHLYGQSAAIEEIAAICKEEGIYLIEDAAEALGASYGEKQLGTFGDFGIYSFNGNKILTTSGGGMLVSDNGEWVEKAKFYATQAREDEIHYQHKEYGYNYRMSNVLAAIGVAQMELLSERVAQKRTIFKWYEAAFEEMGISLMPEIDDSYGNRWLTTILLEDGDPTSVIEALDKQNIESRPLWKPMHMQPLFDENLIFDNGVSSALFASGVCLPSGTEMREEDVRRVAQCIREHRV